MLVWGRFGGSCQGDMGVGIKRDVCNATGMGGKYERGVGYGRDDGGVQRGGVPVRASGAGDDAVPKRGDYGGG